MRWSELEQTLVHLSDTLVTELISSFVVRETTADCAEGVFLPLFPLIKYSSIGH